MADWKKFNEWEEENRRRTLPKLTVKESFRQFCEVWEFSMTLAQAGLNFEYLRNLETDPHLKHLIEFKRTLEKARGKC
jgi:hypothetical protein